MSKPAETHPHFPIPDWLASYQKQWLRADLVAGRDAIAEWARMTYGWMGR